MGENEKYLCKIVDEQGCESSYFVTIKCASKKRHAFFRIAKVLVTYICKFLGALLPSLIVAVVAIESLVPSPHFYIPSYLFVPRNDFLEATRNSDKEIVRDFDYEFLKILERPDMNNVYVGLLTLQLENDVVADNVTLFLDRYESFEYRDKSDIYNDAYIIESDIVEEDFTVNLKTLDSMRKIYIPFCITRPITEKESKDSTASFWNTCEKIVIEFKPVKFTYENSRRKNLHPLIGWLFADQTYSQIIGEMYSITKAKF